MGKKCSVPGCRSGYLKTSPGQGLSKISFHSFPMDETLKNIWLRKIKRPNWKPTPYANVCSLHFKDSWFQKESKDSNKHRVRHATGSDLLRLRRLLPDAIPTIFEEAGEICCFCNTKSAVGMFKFPKEKEFRMKWLHFTEIEDISGLNAKKLCYKHFDLSCFKFGDTEELSEKTELNGDAIPTIKWVVLNTNQKVYITLLSLSLDYFLSQNRIIEPIMLRLFEYISHFFYLELFDFCYHIGRLFLNV